MTDDDVNLFAVFSRRPDHVSASEYDAWYHAHAQENIESPGFVGARRYAARCTNGNLANEERHLSLYRFEGPGDRWRTHLNQRIADGDVVLPEWFGDIEFLSWECTPISGLYVPPSAS